MPHKLWQEHQVGVMDPHDVLHVLVDRDDRVQILHIEVLVDAPHLLQLVSVHLNFILELLEVVE